MLGVGRKIPEVAFVILTWNSERWVEACVESVCSLSSVAAIACVVDNGSEDATLRKLDELGGRFANLVVHRLPRNMGTTAPRNAVLKSLPADIDYVCVLDSDTVVNDGAISALCGTLAGDSTIGIVGPSMADSAGRRQLSGRNLPTVQEKALKAFPLGRVSGIGERMETPLGPRSIRARDVGYLLSACWMMRRSLLDEVGYLDEAIFYAPEDADYCLRVWKSGLRVFYQGGARIVHEYQRLSRSKVVSRINWEHVKGLAYYFAKHGYLFDASKAFGGVL